MADDLRAGQLHGDGLEQEGDAGRLEGSPGPSRRRRLEKIVMAIVPPSEIKKRQPSTVDWGVIESLFYNGIDRPTICKKMGVTSTALGKRIARGQWVRKRSEALQMKGQVLSDVGVKTITAKSEKIRATLIDEAEATAETLRKLPIVQNLNHLDQRASVSSKISTVASKACGWADGQIGRAVDMNLLAAIRINVLIAAPDGGPQPVPISSEANAEEEPPVAPAHFDVASNSYKIK